MKANELRIGNLVECDTMRDLYKDRIPYFGKHIHAVHSACVDFVKLELGDEAIQKVEIFAVKPIPLTEEWLLKFGFQYGFGKTERLYLPIISIDYFLWGSKSDNFTSCTFIINRVNKIKINYVHQLQNLYFILTGKELIIKRYETE